MRKEFKYVGMTEEGKVGMKWEIKNIGIEGTKVMVGLTEVLKKRSILKEIKV